MIEVGCVGRFKAYVDGLSFAVSISDLIKDDRGEALMRLLDALDNADMKVRHGRIEVSCGDVNALYIEDVRAKPGYSFLAIMRFEDFDGVNYFTVRSDPLTSEYVHYHEWVDSNENSRGYLYEDITEYIFEYEEDMSPENLSAWIEVFSSDDVVERFPELEFVVKRLEKLL